jgi:hypothetical protein
MMQLGSLMSETGPDKTLPKIKSTKMLPIQDGMQRCTSAQVNQ